MPRTSVSTYSLREQLGPISIAFTDATGAEQTFVQDFPQVMSIADVPARAAAELDVAGVETVAFQFDGLDDPRIDAFADGARRAGLSLVNAAVDVGDLLCSDRERRSRDLGELERWVQRFADVGFARVRVNPGSPFTRHDGGPPPAHLVEALGELGAFASSRGTRLLVENHGGPSSDVTWMGALLDAVGERDLGLLLDLGNFDALLGPVTRALFGGDGSVAADPFDGVDLAPVYQGIEALSARAELVHVKAHRVQGEAVGPLDLTRALRLLPLRDEDWLTVEYEGTGEDPWGKTRRVLEVTAAATSHGSEASPTPATATATATA